MNLPRPPYNDISWQEAYYLINQDTDNYGHIDLSRGSKRRRSSHTWPYGRDNGKTRTHSTIDNSSCAVIVRSFVNIQDSCQCRMCSHPASSRPGPADRYAPSGLPFPPLRGGPLPLVKPRTATPVRRHGQHPRRETRHSRTGVLPQVNATGTRAWTYGVGNGCAPSHTCKHEKESPDDLSSEDSFKARRLPTLPPGLAVPSAMTGLASLFGMGRGGSPSL